ncbi:CGNR zinc finger domain-containing protein [Pseudoduganella sp. UC29_71]|jgi:predicted RNA-binding Zn ribbon-like protein|uniref:CGNR zinc finger domain-containing protein n=1 Tax=Pseudoduganella sp. UC29_71 TaxID=3350174 RepID=UPI00366F6807
MTMEFLGDHPALDLLNTVIQVQGVAMDSWQSGADVAEWLARAGYAQQGAAPVAELPDLLHAARELRELVRKLVARRKAGLAMDQADLAALNTALAHGRRHTVLAAAGDGALALRPVYADGTARQVLAPLAESAAELIAGDFTLVKHCENPDCSMWFADRTKSHRRRWCSMAICGNRHKVASFRQRRAA